MEGRELASQLGRQVEKYLFPLHNCWDYNLLHEANCVCCAVSILLSFLQRKRKKETIFSFHFVFYGGEKRLILSLMLAIYIQSIHYNERIACAQLRMLCAIERYLPAQPGNNNKTSLQLVVGNLSPTYCTVRVYAYTSDDLVIVLI